MKVKLLVSRASINFVQNAGDVIDVPEAEGKRMIDANQAVLVREEKKERAIKRSKSEKAVK